MQKIAFAIIYVLVKKSTIGGRDKSQDITNGREGHAPLSGRQSEGSRPDHRTLHSGATLKNRYVLLFFLLFFFLSIILFHPSIDSPHGHKDHSENDSQVPHLLPLRCFFVHGRLCPVHSPYYYWGIFLLCR